MVGWRSLKTAQETADLGNCLKRENAQTWLGVNRGGCETSFGPRKQRSPKSLLHRCNTILHRCKRFFACWGGNCLKRENAQTWLGVNKEGAKRLLDLFCTGATPFCTGAKGFLLAGSKIP